MYSQNPEILKRYACKNRQIDTFLKILALATIPVGAFLVAGISSFWGSPGKKLRSIILHFAGGVVFSVVASEILPDVVKRHQPLEIGIGFALGVATMLGLKAFESKAEPAVGVVARYPLALVVSIGIDLILDGVLIGIAFTAGQKEGVLLAIAMAVEVLSLGFATGVSLGSCTKPIRLASIVGLSLALLAGTAIGAVLLNNAPAEVVELTLSFGLAALLYLVTEQLLVEAHNEPETPIMVVSFFAGFLLLLLLGMTA